MQQEITTLYTKGEWYLQKFTDAYTNIIRCNNGKGHETIFIASTPQNALPEARANAKLMSAAPDLLESLREVIAISDRNHVAWNKAKAAIEKAIGNLHGKSNEQPVEQKEENNEFVEILDNCLKEGKKVLEELKKQNAEREQKENDAVDVDELWDEHSELIDDDIDSLSRWAGSTVVDKEQFRTVVAKIWEQLNQQSKNK